MYTLCPPSDSRQVSAGSRLSVKRKWSPCVHSLEAVITGKRQGNAWPRPGQIQTNSLETHSMGKLINMTLNCQTQVSVRYQNDQI